MSEALTDSLIADVGAVIRDRLGLHFPPERTRELEAALEEVAVELHCVDAEECAKRIASEPLDADDLKTLAQALTVGETNFFRDAELFQTLERQILPALIEKRRNGDKRIRIWSAGCCTGEEPYTIAMLLRRVLTDIEDWNVTLLATDLNASFLARAEEGIYGKWSFRRTPPWVQRRHFSAREGGRMEIDRDIREMVSFAYLNLAEESYPSVFNNTNAMDVVLCRNVMIYFDQPTVERVVTRLRSSLLPGGWLALGRSERIPESIDQLERVVVQGDVWYRRTVGHRTEPAPSQPIASDVRPTPERTVLRSTPFPLSLQALLDDGDYGAVATQLTDYLRESTPNRVDRRRALRMLAQAHANLGELAEAQNWCEEAIAEHKLDPRLHYLLASVLLELDRVNEAEASLQRAIVVDDRFVLAHFALGNLKRRSRHPESARDHFERTVALLRFYRPDEIIPDSEGLTAGRLSEITESALSRC